MREPGTGVGYLLVFCVWLLVHGLAEGGCGDRQAHKCCPGRNNDCSDFSPRRTPCYCDTYCEKTGDCCEDYHSVCQISAVDCGVGPWGPWSECNALCGTGSKDRTRQVTVPPRNGGTPCPDLKQRRGCLGENSACDTAKEVAKILPDAFKRDFKDPWRRPHMLTREKLPRRPLFHSQSFIMAWTTTEQDGLFCLRECCFGARNKQEVAEANKKLWIMNPKRNT